MDLVFLLQEGFLAAQPSLLAIIHPGSTSWLEKKRESRVMCAMFVDSVSQIRCHFPYVKDMTCVSYPESA